MELQLDLFADDQQNRVIAEWTEYHADGVEHWKDDASMVEMYEQDLKDGLNVIAIAFETGPEAAMNALRSMDTAPREVVWEMLEKHGYQFD